MKKIFTREHEFAIRKVVQGRTAKMIPVVREPGFLSQWRPIVKLYDTYQILDFEHPKGLTKAECEAHIKGYKKQIDFEKALSTRVEELELFTKTV